VRESATGVPSRNNVLEYGFPEPGRANETPIRERSDRADLKDANGNPIADVMERQNSITDSLGNGTTNSKSLGSASPLVSPQSTDDDPPAGASAYHNYVPPPSSPPPPASPSYYAAPIFPNLAASRAPASRSNVTPPIVAPPAKPEPLSDSGSDGLIDHLLARFGVKNEYRPSAGFAPEAPDANAPELAPQQTIAAQELLKQIPASDLRLLAQIGIPLAQLGTTI
jgi:hypothetical protein